MEKWKREVSQLTITITTTESKTLSSLNRPSIVKSRRLKEATPSVVAFVAVVSIVDVETLKIISRTRQRHLQLERP